MIGYRLGRVWVFGAGQNERTLALQGFLRWPQQDMKSGQAVHNGHLCITRYNSKTNLYNTDKPKPP